MDSCTYLIQHPRRPRGRQSGREKRLNERFQVRAKEPLGTDSRRAISTNSSGCRLLIGHKNALYYCAQSANSFSWVLFVSSYTTAIVSPHLPGSFTKLVRARETLIFYFPNQKRKNYRWVEKSFGMLSAGAIEFGPNILSLTDHNSQISNSLTRQKNNFARASRFFVQLHATRENA